uniref:Uncharacterized protein n=1 Tax=Populus trichocarpa TaxID=3694 RepID=A0A3N7F2D9_POPTR
MRHIYITSPQNLPHTLSELSKKSSKRDSNKKFFLYALQAIVASSTGTRDKLYQHLKLYRQALEFSQSNLDRKENANKKKGKQNQYLCPSSGSPLCTNNYHNLSTSKKHSSTLPKYNTY